MDDDAAVDAAIAPTAEEEAPPPEAPAPKRKPRAKAKPQEIKEPETPRAERAKPVADPSLLWAAVLKTQRAMEKEARSAKLSSLRIV
jgi:hypothetical protein